MRLLALLALLAAGLFAGAVIAAPVPKEPKKTDAQLLEGKWVSVTRDDGRGEQPYQGCTFNFKEGRLSTDYGGDDTEEGPFTLDDSKSPKQLDFAIPTVKKPLECIYKIEGDTLTLCHGPRKNLRVTEFQGGNGAFCFVFKRVKDEKKEEKKDR